MENKLLRYLPSVIWVGIIFYLSHQPGDESSETSLGLVDLIGKMLPFIDEQSEVIHFIVRKLAHFSAYAFLAILIYYAHRGRYRGRITLLASVILASMDEFHQSFVPGRSGEIRDVLIDFMGALFAVLMIKLYLKIRNRSGRNV